MSANVKVGDRVKGAFGHGYSPGEFEATVVYGPDGAGDVAVEDDNGNLYIMEHPKPVVDPLVEYLQNVSGMGLSCERRAKEIRDLLGVGR